jgi:hypothetical protein
LPLFKAAFTLAKCVFAIKCILSAMFRFFMVSIAKAAFSELPLGSSIPNLSDNVFSPSRNAFLASMEAAATAVYFYPPVV